MIILFLKYNSVRTHEQKTKEAAAAGGLTAMGDNTSAPFPLGKDAGVQTEDSLSKTVVIDSLG